MIRITVSPDPIDVAAELARLETDGAGAVATFTGLVRETTDVIERLCIEAALKLTGDNRATAAELLGLSRQSLYVKLRRFGLADASEDDEHRIGQHE
jgi:DNA-binding NtrC family response regulator